MAKSKYLEFSFVFWVFIFHQSAFGQNTPAPAAAKPAVAANPAVLAKPAVVEIEEESESDIVGRKVSLQDKKALTFLGRTNLREVDRIKWPENPDLEGPTSVKYQDIDGIKSLSEKVKVTLQNCKKQSAQYEKEVQASYGIKKGTIFEFEFVCERLGIALKRIKNPNHPGFNVTGIFVMNRLDTALFRYLETADYERTKVYQKSLFGMLGLPVKYMGPVLQILSLLSLVLNGFLLYKVFFS